MDQFQIEVIQDLPVGHNLQDHVGVGGLVFLIDHKVSLVQNRYENMPSVLQYAMFGQGKEEIGYSKTFSKSSRKRWSLGQCNIKGNLTKFKNCR